MAECSFRPKISRTSEEIMLEKALEKDVHDMEMMKHEELYQDADRRQRRREEYSTWFPEEYTFQPNLKKWGNKVNSGGHHHSTASSHAHLDQDIINDIDKSFQKTDTPFLEVCKHHHF